VQTRTKAGYPCQAPAVEGDLCFCHAHPERLAEFGRQGGQKNRRGKHDESDLPDRSLKSIGEVSALLEETINRVRQGPFDLRAANAIGFLAGILLKALDQPVELPETTNSEASPGIYTSLFQRLALPAAPQDRVFDLFPQPAQKDAGIASGPVPAPGEFIDDTMLPGTSTEMRGTRDERLQLRIPRAHAPRELAVGMARSHVYGPRSAGG
jgi:hypothetical protein